MSADPASRPAAAQAIDDEETRRGELPTVIQLPDRSQPEPPRGEPPKPGRHTGRMKGRHFGPRPIEDPRTAWLTSRCTPAFLAKVRADAEAAGLSLSDYLHAELGGERKPRAPRRTRLELQQHAEIVAALGRSGNNLNQLLKRVNAYDFRGIPELIEIAKAMQAAHAAHHALVAAIMADMGL
jgi:hypothetical protein